MNCLPSIQSPQIISHGHIFDFQNHTLYRNLVEHIVQMPVKDLSFYTEAFTHKSALQWFGLNQSYERLEFIGDSVLGLIVTRFLFEKYPRVQEGFLTRLRTKIVSGKMLCQFARMLSLQNYLLMDIKALSSKWNENDRILEDVFEALLGAIYQDLGLESCKTFLMPFLHNLDFDLLLEDKNYKDIIMRYCQSKGWNLPTYILEEQAFKYFKCRVVINNEAHECGEGSTKKEAEQQAAKKTIIRLGFDPNELKRK